MILFSILLLVLFYIFECHSMLRINKESIYSTVNQQILAAIKFGVSPRPVYAVYDRRHPNLVERLARPPRKATP